MLGSDRRVVHRGSAPRSRRPVSSSSADPSSPHEHCPCCSTYPSSSSSTDGFLSPCDFASTSSGAFADFRSQLGWDAATPERVDYEGPRGRGGDVVLDSFGCGWSSGEWERQGEGSVWIWGWRRSWDEFMEESRARSEECVRRRGNEYRREVRFHSLFSYFGRLPLNLISTPQLVFSRQLFLPLPTCTPRQQRPRLDVRFSLHSTYDHFRPDCRHPGSQTSPRPNASFFEHFEHVS